MADVGSVYPTLMVNSMTITEGSFDAPEIHVTLHRTPTATALDNVVRHCPTSIGTDEDNVCLIALTEETALAYLEETGWIMAHQFDETFKRQYTLIYEFEHRNE